MTLDIIYYTSSNKQAFTIRIGMSWSSAIPSSSFWYKPLTGPVTSEYSSTNNQKSWSSVKSAAQVQTCNCMNTMKRRYSNDIQQECEGVRITQGNAQKRRYRKCPISDHQHVKSSNKKKYEVETCCSNKWFQSDARYRPASKPTTSKRLNKIKFDFISAYNFALAIK